MSVCLVALGSNLGDRRQILDRAIEMLSATAGIHSVNGSTWHASSPVGGPTDQREFLNGAARLETSLTPLELLHDIGQIEQQLGRQRNQRWAARTIDIDLLLFDHVVLDMPELTVPHPRMAFRRFVLAPAAEIGGELVHPLFGWTIAQLFDHLRHAPNLMAICDLDDQDRGRRLAASLAATTGAQLAAVACAAPLVEVTPPATTWRIAADAVYGDQFLAFLQRGPAFDRSCGNPLNPFAQLGSLPKVVAIRSASPSPPVPNVARAAQQALVRTSCPWLLLPEAADVAIAELTAIIESMR